MAKLLKFYWFEVLETKQPTRLEKFVQDSKFPSLQNLKSLKKLETILIAIADSAFYVIYIKNYIKFSVTNVYF